MESTTPIGELEPAGKAEIQPRLVAGIGETCAGCGGSLSADQRYCVECGERRGAAALPFTGGSTRRAPAAPEAPRAPRMRISSSTTLIAGVGTLLLALGVGVLIGRGTGSNASSKSSPPPQVVTIAGAGGAAATATSTTPAAPATPTPTSPAKAKKAPAAPATAKANATTAAAPRPTTGPNRPGYTNGKFTGNFFGP